MKWKTLGLALLLIGSSDVWAEVTQFDGVTLQAKTDVVDGTGYIRLDFPDLSIPAGYIVVCADLQMSIPALANQEIELWPAMADSLPWSNVDEKARTSRQVHLVANGADGFLRFDLTKPFQDWVAEMSGKPAFFLRIRPEEGTRGITTQQIIKSRLVFHTVPRPKPS